MERRKSIAETELILNRNGSVYHLHLLPEHIAENVILVGDPARVDLVSQCFDTISFKIQNREFVSHGGTYKNKQVMAVSSGIGTDNIDIVLNELDAAVNIDLNKRIPREKHTTLKLIRIGTSGALQSFIPVNSVVVSEYALGLDGLLHYYDGLPAINNDALSEAFCKHTNWHSKLPYPYAIAGSENLMDQIAADYIKGITVTAPGFYAPQGRELRLKPWMTDFNQQLTGFKFGSGYISNFEMETSALYGLGTLLGHQVCSVCVIIANRITREFNSDYSTPMNNLIEQILERLTK